MAALLIGLTCRGASAAEAFVSHHEDVMGTSMELRLSADSEAPATAAIRISRPRSAGPASPTYSGSVTPRALIRPIHRPSRAGSKHTLLTM